MRRIDRTVCGAVFLATALIATGSKAATTLTTLVSFDGTNGATPLALAQADDGSLYGTTHFGGADFVGPPSSDFFGSGTLYRLTPGGTFSNLANGVGQPTYIMRTADGNYFGSLQSDGLFKLAANGLWTNIYSFPSDGSSGSLPSVLVEVSTGDIYGLTQFSDKGFSGGGTVFRFGTNGSFQTMAHFDGTNGYWPAALLQGRDGNLYGVTQLGGELDHGVVFKMTPGGDLQVLMSFRGTNGSHGSWLLQGTDGCLYGTTYRGGQGNGTVFRVTTNGTLIWSFALNGTNGSDPLFMIQASDGNLYGTTELGGDSGGGGTVFRITPDGALTSLLSFGQTNGSGAFFLLQGADGNLYGTTEWGGAGLYGTVFRLSVPMAPVFRNPTLPNGAMGLTWNSVAGFSYQLQYTSDLNSTNWNNLGDPVVATNGMMFASDVLGPDPQRFYRVVLLP